MSTPVTVMHLVDTLAVGGAERMAVNLANSLPRDRFRPHLCSTRADGPLAGAVAADVVRLNLDRTHRLDAAALARLVAHVRRHDVRVLHAHSASVFAAVLASLLPPYPAVVWHDHYGPPLESRKAWPYRAIAGRLAHVVAVNESLAGWARSTIGVPAGRVSYVANFVSRAPPRRSVAGLPGAAGRRVACVANLRPQKDHATLIAAFARVVAAVPDAHLLLLGAESDGDHSAALRRAANEAGIAHRVSWLGVRQDVPDVLRECAVGVLSSLSEGLPLAVLEYGMAGLATVATEVGQCGDVLDHGRAGVLVPPSEPDALARALIDLLGDPPRRAVLGGALQARVEECYGEAHAVAAVTAIYDAILQPVAGDAAALRQRGRMTTKTPKAGRVDGAAAPTPIGGGGLSGVMGRESVPPS